jgi:ABC-2 type transport system permease protein
VNRQFLRLVLLVARRDYVRTVRRRGFVAGTLLLPLAMGVVFAISALASSGSLGPGGPGGGEPLVVVNESAVPITADPLLAPDVEIVDRATAEVRLAARAVDRYFVVPATWPGQPRIVSIERAGAGANPMEALGRVGVQQAEVQALLRTSLMRAAGLDDADLARVLAPITVETLDEDGKPVSEATAAASYFVPYIFTLIFILSLFITSGYLLQSVTEEKENRVVEILLSSVPALPLMAGKILGLGLAGLTQIGIWVGTALVVLPFANRQFATDISLSPVTLILALVVFALGYMGYGAIFAAVGAIAPGAREGQQYSSFFGFLAVIPIILTPVFVSDPGSPLVVALCVLPLTAPAALLQLLALSASPPWAIVIASLISQVAFVALAVVASSRIFRATLLLYGVRPSLRRIADAVFARN